VVLVALNSGTCLYWNYTRFKSPDCWEASRCSYFSETY